MAIPSVALRQSVADGSRATKVAYAGVLVFLLVYWSRPSEWIAGAGRFPFAKIAGFFVVAVSLPMMGRLRTRLPQEVIYLILLLVQLLLTVPFSPVWRGGAFAHVLDFSKVVLITLVMSLTVVTLGRLHQLIFLQTAAVATTAALAWMQGKLLVGGRLAGAGYSSFGGNPNDLALAIAMSIPFTFAFALGTPKSLRKMAWASIGILMAYVLFRTASRSGFLTFLVSVGVCLWEFAIRGRRRNLLILAPIAASLVWLFTSGPLENRFVAMFNPELDRAAHGSAERREQLFLESVKVTCEHPLFGIGPGNFAVISGNWQVSHNSYTQISSEGGVPALILYLMILWRAFANVRRAKRLTCRRTEEQLVSGALQASLAAYVVGSSFASVPYEFFPYFLVAYTTALVRIAMTHHLLSPEVPQANHAAGSKDELCGESAQSGASALLAGPKIGMSFLSGAAERASGRNSEGSMATRNWTVTKGLK